MTEELLKQFADETVELEVKEEYKSIPEVADMLAEVYKAIGNTSFAIGKSGEEFIIEKLSAKGYIAVKTKGSRSDSDIFALKKINEKQYHLMLVQVKATKKADEPTILSENEIENLKKFNWFVVYRWLNSKLVSDELKQCKVIVSCGYTGVVFKGKSNPELFEPICYQFCYHNSLVSQKEELKKVIIVAHKIN